MADDSDLLAKLHELVAAQAKDLTEMRKQIAALAETQAKNPKEAQKSSDSAEERKVCFSDAPAANAKVLPEEDQPRSTTVKHNKIVPMSTEDKETANVEGGAVLLNIPGENKTQTEQNKKGCCHGYRRNARDLSKQYDKELRLIYRNHWNLPLEESQKPCCYFYSCKRDDSIRKKLKEVFPPYVFWLLTIAGAIPPPYAWMSYILTGLWALLCAAILLNCFAALFTFGSHLACRYLFSNCYVIELGLSFSTIISNALTSFSLILSIILVHTHLRKQLHSTELHTLLTISDPERERIRNPRLNCGWTFLPILFYVGSIFLVLGEAAESNELLASGVHPLTVAYFFIQDVAILISPLAIALHIYVVTRSMILCYDEWAIRMHGDEDTSLSQPASEVVDTPRPPPDVADVCGRVSQLESYRHNRAKTQQESQTRLLGQLRARVSLSALVTRQNTLLLLPALFALEAAVFAILHVVSTSKAVEAAALPSGTTVIRVLFIQILPLLVPFQLSIHMSILDNLASQQSFADITGYLGSAPKLWMLTQTIMLTPSLLTPLALSSASLWAVGAFLDKENQAMTMPWKNGFERYGTCADGLHSGREQFIDCGPPDSSCPHTCREKYGEYLVIPGTRECSEIDGYAHITTQRACTVGYRTWALAHNRSTTLSAQVYAGANENYLFGKWERAMWKEEDAMADVGFRCGAYPLPLIQFAFGPVTRYAFPALFWPLTKPGNTFKPLAYLCYSGNGRESCAADTDNKAFEEMMACPAREEPASDSGLVPWREISGPLAQKTHALRNKTHLVEFSAENYCAKIKVNEVAARSGAQVVFAMSCAPVTDVPCPKNNIVKLSVESGGAASVRGTLFVSTTPNMNMTAFDVHELEVVDSKEMTVEPESTLMLVVDWSASLPLNVKLCYDA